MLVVVGIGHVRGTAETGRAADQRLVDALPKGRGPHEGLVVEASAKEWAQQRVEGQQVEAQRRPAVLACGFEAIIELDRRRLCVRFAARAVAQLDQRVRLFRAGGENPARPVILEAASDQLRAVCQQCRSQRIARVAIERGAVERRRSGCERSISPPEGRRSGCALTCSAATIVAGAERARSCRIPRRGCRGCAYRA